LFAGRACFATSLPYNEEYLFNARSAQAITGMIKIKIEEKKTERVTRMGALRSE
jgi:hypothetical protein